MLAGMEAHSDRREVHRASPRHHLRRSQPPTATEPRWTPPCGGPSIAERRAGHPSTSPRQAWTSPAGQGLRALPRKRGRGKHEHQPPPVPFGLGSKPPRPELRGACDKPSASSQRSPASLLRRTRRASPCTWSPLSSTLPSPAGRFSRPAEAAGDSPPGGGQPPAAPPSGAGHHSCRSMGNGRHDYIRESVY